MVVVTEFSSEVIHFLCGDWSRAMVDKSIDHENDVMVAQLFCFSHFPCPIHFTDRSVKPLTCDSWLYLSFKRFDVISLGALSIVWKIVVNLLVMKEKPFLATFPGSFLLRIKCPLFSVWILLTTTLLCRLQRVMSWMFWRAFSTVHILLPQQKIMH